MIHFDEPYLTIHWDEDIQAVWMEWKQFAEGEPFRRGLDLGIELLRQKKTSRWIADLRNLGPVAPPDAKWSNEDWFPRAVAAGVRWMAMVQPRKVVAKMALKMTMNQVHQASLTTAYFDNLEDARAWIRGQR